MLKYITVVYPDEITVAFKANKTQALSDESISFTDMSVGFRLLGCGNLFLQKAVPSPQRNRIRV